MCKVKDYSIENPDEVISGSRKVKVICECDNNREKMLSDTKRLFPNAKITDIKYASDGSGMSCILN